MINEQLNLETLIEHPNSLINTAASIDEAIKDLENAGYKVVVAYHASAHIIYGRIEPMEPIEQIMASGDNLFCKSGGKMYEYYYGFWKPTEHFQWRVE